MEENTKEFLDRFKAEVEGQGLSLRQMDDALEVGIRHKFHKGTKRALEVDDYFRGTAALKLDPFRLLARIAGYGDPFDITALRGSRAPVWPPEQKDILDSLEDLKRAGGDGFEEIREELRRLEHLHEDDPQASEQATWAWLAHERRPGAVVGLLAALAVHQKKTKAHALLDLGNTILGEELDNAVGGKLSTAAGRCFIAAGFAREGLHILEHFALRIVTIYGSSDDQCSVLYYIGRAAASLGRTELSERALHKVIAQGTERLRYYSLQCLAYQKMASGDIEQARFLYEELVRNPYFEGAPLQVKAAINHSLLAARSATGALDESQLPAFENAVAGVRQFLPLKEQVAAVMDLAKFLEAIGRVEQAGELLQEELWNVTSLDDVELIRKYAGLWDALKLPRDSRWNSLTGRLKEE